MEFDHIRIILVGTAGPLNLGSVARAMKNFGLYHLTLVAPQCDPLSSDARKMAVHAQDVLNQAKTCDSLVEALAGCSRVLATTTKSRMAPVSLEPPDLAIPWLLEIEQPVALIFGSEESGLSNEELQLAQRWMCLPTHPNYPTLNLAQSVVLCCYELFRYGVEHQPIPPPEPSATIDAMEGYLEHFSSLLLEIGYLYPHTRNSRMEKFRHLLHRSQPSSAELAMLRGVISQMEWALKNQSGK